MCTKYMNTYTYINIRAMAHQATCRSLCVCGSFPVVKVRIHMILLVSTVHLKTL